jgi:WD40 repeat protein
MKLDTDKLLKQYEPREVAMIKQDRQVHAARYSPCGKLLLAGGYDGLVRRWEVTGDKARRLPPVAGQHGFVQGLAFAGDRVFTADSWGHLRCWAYAEEKPKTRWEVKAAHEGWIRNLSVSPDGKTLASCGVDQVVRLWSTSDGKKQKELVGHNDDVLSVAFAPDGRSLVSGDLPGVVKSWDLASGKPQRDFDASVLYFYHRIQDIGGVRSLVFDAASKRLVVGGCRPSGGGFVQGTPVMLVFDYATGKQLESVDVGGGADGFVFDMHFHSDDFLMAVTSGQPGKGQIIYRRVGDAKPLFATTTLSNCHSLSLSPDGTHLAVTATSKGSNGNGRRLDKAGNYIGNSTPIHLFALGEAELEKAKAK